MPVYEGYGIKHATDAVQIGGRDVTERLKTLLSQQGKMLSTTAEFQIVKGIKEKHCFVNNSKKSETERQCIEPVTDFEVRISLDVHMISYLCFMDSAFQLLNMYFKKLYIQNNHKKRFLFEKYFFNVVCVVF